MTLGEPRVFRVVSLLGIAQVVSWGTLYYSIAILAKPVASELKLGDLEVFTAFSVGLLLSGLLAPATGRWIDRFGGRLVMTAGSLFAVAGFLLLATANSVFQYYAGWLVAGLAMSATLYDATFASLRRLFSGTKYRKAVTGLTILGGLASTAFWPLSAVLNQLAGWRWTYAVFAVLHVGCVLVHGTSPDRGNSSKDTAAETASGQPLFRDPRYLALAVGFACAAFSFSAMSTFAVRVLSGYGLSAPTALWIVSLIGPMQVAGRFLEYLAGRHLSVLRTGAAAHVLVVVALLLLCFVGGNIVLGILFAVIYGIANGMMTVVRGAAPMVLIPGSPPGKLLGGLALPSAVSRAAAPAVFAFLAQVGGSDSLPILFCAGLALIALGSYLWACRAAK